MIFKLLEKHNEQNELTEDNSDNIININKSESKAIKFEESAVKDKKKTEDNDELIMSKIKNVKFADVLHKIIKQNSTYIIQKIFCAVVSNIIVENILTSEFIVHKLMFKSKKSDFIVKIFETEKINVNNIKTHCITNILYFSVNFCAVVNIRDE